MLIGAMLSFFSILSLLFVVFFNKNLCKLFSNYYFYAILGIISFVYFWVARQQENFMNLINHDKEWRMNINGKPMDNKYFTDLHDSLYFRDIIFSKALFLDLCPFVAFATCFGLVFDRKRNFVKIMAPYGFAGSVITIFFFLAKNELGAEMNYYPVTEWWDFIFGNKVFFTMHYFTLVIGLIVFLNTPGYSVRSLIGTIAFPTFYFIYVGIIVNVFDLNHDATGLVSGDWELGGQYYPVGQLIKIVGFPLFPMIAFGLVFSLILISIFLRNVMIVSNKWKYERMIAFPRMSTSLCLFYEKLSTNLYNNFIK